MSDEEVIGPADLGDASSREPLAQLRGRSELVALGRRYGATIGIHDDIDAAIAVGAAAVHLPGGGDPTSARQKLPRALIGVSAHSASEAAAAIEAGADYVTLSPIFLSESKPGYGPALGLDGLTAAAAATPSAVVALAGITPENAALCLAAGARGVAAMGEVMRATDPEATVRALLNAMQV